jgi:prolipoprotein diacylglyceryltransferase
MALDLAAFAFLLWVRKKLHLDWDLFLLSVASYGLIRFVVEFFRAHANPNAAIFFQSVSMVLLLVCTAVVYWRERKAPVESSA